MQRRSFATTDALWSDLERRAKREGKSVSRLLREAYYAQHDADGSLAAQEVDAGQVSVLVDAVLSFGAVVLVAAAVILMAVWLG